MLTAKAILMFGLTMCIVGCGGTNPSSVASKSSLGEAQPRSVTPEWSSLATAVGIDGTKTISTEVFSTSGTCELYLRKRGARVEIILKPPQFIGTEGGRVRWKIDDGPIHTEKWQGSQSGVGIFSPDPYTLLLALERAGAGHKLVMEYPPYEYEPVKVEFALPATVPPEFQNIAAPIVAKQRATAALDQKTAALEADFQDCMADNRETHATCDAIAKKICDQYGIEVEKAVPCKQ